LCRIADAVDAELFPAIPLLKYVTVNKAVFYIDKKVFLIGFGLLIEFVGLQ